MQELVKVSKQKIGEEEVLAVDARDLHEALGVRKDFSSWIKDQLVLFEENQDFVSSTLKGEGPGKPPRTVYVLSSETAKHIALMSRTKKGMGLRQHFIDLEKRYQRGDLSLAEEVIDKNTERKKAGLFSEKELDDSWQQRRLKSTITRNTFTSTLQPRLDSKGGYGRVTTWLYLGAHGQTAKQIRQSRGLPATTKKGGDTRDVMTKRELLKTQMAEGLAELSIEEKDIYGDQACADEAYKAGCAASDTVDGFGDNSKEGDNE